jgi:vesicle-fusing ATPase
MGKTEAAASDVLRKAFDDATKSPLSVLILDDVSKLVQFAKHGPRYSLLLLHTLQSLLKQRPPEERRMVVLATADLGVVHTLDLADSFAHVITLPTLTRDEAAMAVRDSGLAQDSRVLKAAVGQLPGADIFEASIRTLTASLLHSSPTGQLDLTAWEAWQHAFQSPSTGDTLQGLSL